MRMLKTTQMIAAPTTCESVTGAASVSWGTTFAPRFTNDVRSRVTKSLSIIFTYWTGIGRSRPKSLRTSRSVCWSALRPAIRAAGSAPGVAKKMRKTSTLIANSTVTSFTSRRATKATISAGDAELRARVERVAHAVAEDVQREHRERDRDPGRERDRGPRVEELLTVVDDRAPARVGRLHADREERERRLGQHRDRHHQREEDDHGRHHVGQDLAREQAPVARAEPDRGLDELAPP